MTDLPSGTVTFLFTDIEGSTRLWEQHPEAMGEALARHDALLRGAIEAHGGHVFKTVGDQFCAAFATASDAVTASSPVSARVGGSRPRRVCLLYSSVSNLVTSASLWKERETHG